MSDLEGITRILMKRRELDSNILEHLHKEIEFYKGDNHELNEVLARAILSEVKNSARVENFSEFFDILEVPRSGVTMQTGGVGCRGDGDFQVHQKLASLAATVEAELGVRDLDDAGVVEMDTSPEKYLISKIEGMHSRLSDYPFLAGFHVTRAALRDILVKGGAPKSLMIDLHLGDDGDVGKLFDFVAGCATVSKLVNVPIVAGSTLRIGGDMVIGTRLTGCVAAVGTATKILPRKNLRPGQKVIMTGGSGGGTVTTAAIYSGNHHVVKHTLNLNFMKAIHALREASLYDGIDCMVDVTNGGIRNELNESISNLECGIEIDNSVFESMVQEDVLKLLRKLSIDPLGVSIGSLLIFCRPRSVKDMLSSLQAEGVPAAVVGRVIPEKGLFLTSGDGMRERLIVKKREAAYTEVKKALENQELDLEGLETAWVQAKKKIDSICRYIEEKND
ncbi:MAG: AIR synthase-related protein [Candidatus Hodarchaeales archaeon]|jgi:hydrogenase expression/formation protein